MFVLFFIYEENKNKWINKYLFTSASQQFNYVIKAPKIENAWIDRR